MNNGNQLPARARLTPRGMQGMLHAHHTAGQGRACMLEASQFSSLFQNMPKPRYLLLQAGIAQHSILARAAPAALPGGCWDPPPTNTTAQGHVQGRG